MVMAQGYTKEQVKSILDNFEGSELIDEKTKGLLRFAEKITYKPYEIVQNDVNELKDLDLNEIAILEAVYVASGFNMMDRFADALGTPIDNFVEMMSKAQAKRRQRSPN